MSASTSYVTLTPVDAGCRSATEDTVPFPDKTHSALGLCCENNNNFATTSYKKRTRITFIKSTRSDVATKSINIEKSVKTIQQKDSIKSCWHTHVNKQDAEICVLAHKLV